MGLEFLWRRTKSALQREQSIRLILTFYLCIVYVYVIFANHYKAAYSNQWNLKRRAPRDRWAGRRFNLPKMHRVYRWYRILSTSYMTYVVIKTFIPKKLVTRVLQLSWPADCYLMGRLVLSPSLSEVAGLTLAYFHLSWRLIQRSLKRPYRLDMVMFIMQSRRAVDESCANCYLPSSNLVGTSHMLRKKRFFLNK